MSDEISSEELRKFASAFAQLASEAYKLVNASSEIKDLVAEHLSVDPSELPVVVEKLPAVERPNLQLALDSLVDSRADSRVVGLPSELRHYGGFSVGALLAGTFRGPSDPTPVTFDEMPIDVDETLQCVSAGLWFVWHDDLPAVVAAFPGERTGPGDPDQHVEVFAATTEHAHAVQTELQRLRRERNVYRQRVLSFTFSQYGEFGISFLPRPETRESDVILPTGDLASIRRHTIGIAEQADTPA